MPMLFRIRFYCLNKTTFRASVLEKQSSNKMSEDSSHRDSRVSAPTPLSPYLNYEPRFVQQAQPEFILLEDAKKNCYRFDLAPLQIGSCVIVGAGIGGVAGFYNGMRTTAALQQTAKLRRTQLLNHVIKQGSAAAHILGTLSVMYSTFGVLSQLARGKDDELNTVMAGTATGFLYKSTAGLRRCAIGGAVGLGISSLYVLLHMSTR